MNDDMGSSIVPSQIDVVDRFYYYSRESTAETQKEKTN